MLMVGGVCRAADDFASLQKQAEGGDPVAMAALGDAYERGSGVPIDLRQAAAWYQKAAEAGNPMAMKNLGNCLRDGRGIKRDPVAAVGWSGQSHLH